MEPWVIRWDGHEWTDDQVVVAHVVSVCELVGDNWSAVSPWSGPRALAAWISVLWAAASGKPVTDAMTTVFSLPLTRLTSALSTRPVDPPPDPDPAPVPSPPSAPSNSGTGGKVLIDTTTGVIVG
jgi:hypothetical protein